MITKITVESFKSLESVEIDLGAVNVFVGANGSGKSNLLEAIGVLGAAAFGRVDDESLLRRGVRPGVPQLYKSAFPTRQRPHICFSAENSQVSYKVSLWNPIDDPKPAWRFKTESLRRGPERQSRHRLGARGAAAQADSFEAPFGTSHFGRQPGTGFDPRPSSTLLGAGVRSTSTRDAVVRSVRQRNPAD